MKVVVIGVGAMGSLFAGRLSSLVDLIMVGNWPEQLAALKQDGLLMVKPDGQEARIAVKSTNDLSQIADADVALILVKGWQTERAAKQAAEMLSADGLALTLQNGLGNFEIITKLAGKRRAALGVTSEGATMVSAGIVRHAGHGVTHLATTPETVIKLDALAKVFNLAGFETHLTDELNGLVWGKLAVNAGINPLTALLQVPNGFLALHSIARDLMCKAAEETAQVALAQNINLPFESPSQQALAVAEATATNRSSMLQDVLRGMPTEIDAISGAVVTYGRKLGVPTPVNECLLRLMKVQIKTGNWRTIVNELPDEMKPAFNTLAHLEVPA